MLVNNAYSPTAAQDTDLSSETTEEAWDSRDSGCHGQRRCFLPAKHRNPAHGTQNGGGSIINISSVHGLLAVFQDFLVYEASKSAVIGMTRQMAD